MGQKVNPIAFRLPTTGNWVSRWYANDKRYKEFLNQDIKVRNLVMRVLKNAGVSKIIIERSINKATATVKVARPGMVIGRGGSGVEQLKKELESLIGAKLTLNIEEIKKPDLDAYLVARSVADQIEKRLHPKRVIAFAAEKVMQAKAKGVKIIVSGRIGGSEIARREKIVLGSIPLQTIKADIDFAVVAAKTQTAGVVGVKVWISKPEEQISKE